MHSRKNNIGVKGRFVVDYVIAGFKVIYVKDAWEVDQLALKYWDGIV